MIALDQKLLIEKNEDEDTTGWGPSSGVLRSREEPRGLRGQIPEAPDPEVPGREGQLQTEVGKWMLTSVPKLVTIPPRGGLRGLRGRPRDYL